MTTRRDFLIHSSLAIGALALPSIVAAKSKAVNELEKTKGVNTYTGISLCVGNHIVGRVLHATHTLKALAKSEDQIVCVGEIWPTEMLLAHGVLPPKEKILETTGLDEAQAERQQAMRVVFDIMYGANSRFHGPMVAVEYHFQGTNLMYEQWHQAIVEPYQLDPTQYSQRVQVRIPPYRGKSVFNKKFPSLLATP